MTTKEQLEDILVRLEKADGPDRELDVVIGALFKQPYKERKNYSNRWVGSVRQHTSVRHIYQPYTASLDAAIALCEEVLPGWRITMAYQPGRFASVNVFDPESDYGAVDDSAGHGRTSHPALALLIAILKAKIAEKEAAQ